MFGQLDLRQAADLPPQWPRHRAWRLAGSPERHRHRRRAPPRSAIRTSPVGLVAGDGGALIWPQLIGYAQGQALSVHRRPPRHAAEAERIGLISEVVPEADIDTRVYGLAERLAAGPLKAVMKWTKVVANLPLKALFHAHFDAGVAYETMSNLSADHQEAVAAFREKRKPAFTGR